MIHIVLVEPKIPNNTGNIIRLCANTGATLHLVKPLGFELDDKKLRRAGLDYHEYANLQVHENWASLRAVLHKDNCGHMVALTTKFSHPLYDYDFNANAKTAIDENVTAEISSLDTASLDVANTNIALVFGSETDGLPQYIRDDIDAGSEGKNWLRLPMLPHSRSLNLSNSVAICLYEVWRQLGFSGDEGESDGYHRPNSRVEE